MVTHYRSFDINFSLYTASFFVQSTKLSITLSKYLGSLAQPIISKELLYWWETCISLEIEKVGYNGEIYFKATLDMVIYTWQQKKRIFSISILYQKPLSKFYPKWY